MKWRVYRLPGSQKVWHIDSGPGTVIINVAGFMSDVPVKAFDHPDSQQQPRAWVEIEGNLFVDVKTYVARFMAVQALPEFLKPNLCPATCGGSCTQRKECSAAGKCLKKISDDELEALTRPESRPV